MQSANLIPCAHAPCRCLVETEDHFCGEACARARNRGSFPCPCGHPECAENQRASNENVAEERSASTPTDL